MYDVRFKLWRARGAGIWGLLGQTHQDMRLPMYDVRLPNSHAGDSGWTAYVARRVKTADGRKVNFALRAKAVFCPIPLRTIGGFHSLAQSAMV